MKTKGGAHQVLNKLCREIDIPKILVTDGAKGEYFGEWGCIVKEHLIDQRRTDPNSGWQNRCEGEIRELKKHHRRIMSLNKFPKAFWDFGWSYTLELQQFLAREASNDRPPKELVISTQVDISEYMDFEFYGFIKYVDEVDYPHQQRNLGRWLGISHKVGSPMTYWVLKQNGQVIPQSTVQPLAHEEWID